MPRRGKKIRSNGKIHRANGLKSCWGLDQLPPACVMEGGAGWVRWGQRLSRGWHCREGSWGHEPPASSARPPAVAKQCNHGMQTSALKQLQGSVRSMNSTLFPNFWEALDPPPR